MSRGPGLPGEGGLYGPALRLLRGPQNMQGPLVLRPYPHLSPKGALPSPFPGEGLLPPGQVWLFSSPTEEACQNPLASYRASRQPPGVWGAHESWVGPYWGQPTSAKSFFSLGALSFLTCKMGVWW